MTAPRIETRYWLGLWATLVVAFVILGFYGREVYRQAPPIPERVVTAGGSVVTTKDDILTGQQVWQSTGGQQLGSVWGHGAYQAPDWSADWLHREALALLELWAAREHGTAYAALAPEAQAALRARLERELRTNTHDAANGTVTVSPDRAEAVRAVAAHYDALYGGDPALRSLREAYAMAETTVPDPERRRALTSFFFWTAWASVTERPGLAISYTNNWPHEPLVGNRPSAANVAWSIASVVLLLAAVGGLVFWRAFRGSDEEPAVAAPAADPLASVTITPSMRAVAKYLGAVVALFVVQVALGAVTAHYTVEGQGFFGFPLADYLPYSLTRTWHIQTAVFWIATAFLAAGLFLAPVVGGREPRFQRLGVNVLFAALLLVVAGSLAGQLFAVHQRLPLDLSFWLGHQGYEYVDLGRAWQIALFAGLVLWLGLMLRALMPALARRDSSRTLVLAFTGATVAIGLMYGAGFFFSARSHLSVMEYWRWWVVHLWVEGFFEVFATAALSLVFARLGLVEPRHAGLATVASAALFLFAGIPGTFHHLYFSGTPTSVMAVGASFSALEVVPLVLIGLEAFRTSRMQRAAPWMAKYRWPIRFFVGVAFWNFLGAGVFGFLINPPIALYYMQGLNTTPVHAHTALFGVYGLLSLGLVLLVARKLTGDRAWKETPLAVAFWSMNVGLGLMVALSLLPVGIAQAIASAETGLWYARSAEFLQQPWLQTLRWLRMPGDSLFLIGVAAFAWFMAGLWRGWSYEPTAETEPRRERLPVRVAASLVLALLLAPSSVLAHCDTIDGPVVKDARAALEARDATIALKWVEPGKEPEVREAFRSALAVRGLGREAQGLADRYFFETLVRLHRESEGAPYSGLKPAGSPVSPAVAGVDAALEAGDVDAVARSITGAADHGLRARFARAGAAKRHAAEGVEQGRRYVAAYVELTHYAERLLQSATSTAPHAGMAHPGAAEGHAH
jgi:nitric oxide reductase subunit B